MVQCIGVLMEAAPDDLSPALVERKVKSVPGVISVHDLHIWSLSVGKPSLCVHLLCDAPDTQTVLVAVQKLLAEKFRIFHTTIQVEREGPLPPSPQLLPLAPPDQSLERSSSQSVVVWHD